MAGKPCPYIERAVGWAELGNGEQGDYTVSMSAHTLRARALWRGLELILITLILSASYLPGIGDVEFHGDESMTIFSSESFEPFIHGDIHSHVWEEHYWTLTQPPLSRYVVGVGRTLGGYDDTRLNNPWNFFRSEERNIREGNMPTPGLLWWSRLPMALLAVVSGIAVFYLVSAAVGPVGGWVAVLLFALNPYLHTTLRQALTESPLLTCALLAALAALGAVPRWSGWVSEGRGAWWRGVAWLSLVGALAGMAAEAKLNGLALIGAMMILVAVAALSEPGAAGWGRRLGGAALGAGVIGLAGAGTFVALNPFLYHDTLGRVQRMFDQRLTEMANQFESTAYRIPDIAARMTILPQRIFEKNDSLNFYGSGWVSGALTALGVIVLVVLAWRWLRGRREPVAAATLLVFAAAMVGPALATPLDWDRYYLFPEVFSLMCIGVALGGIWRGGWALSSSIPVAASRRSVKRET